MAGLLKFISFFTKYVTLWVIICAVFAYFFPEPLKPYGSWISYFLGIIMLSMGLSMSPNDFKLIFSRPKDVIIGVVTLYIFMPLVGHLPQPLADAPRRLRPPRLLPYRHVVQRHDLPGKGR